MDDIEALTEELSFRKQVLRKKGSDVPTTKVVVEENISADQATGVSAPETLAIVKPRLKAGGSVVKRHQESVKKRAASADTEPAKDTSEPKSKRGKTADDQNKGGASHGFCPSPAEIPEDRYAAATAVFSQVTFPGCDLPPFSELANKQGVGRVAFQGLQYHAEVSRALNNYEIAVKGLNLQVNQLKARLVEQAKVLDRFQGAEAEITALRKANFELAAEKDAIRAEAQKSIAKMKKDEAHRLELRIDMAKMRLKKFKREEFKDFVFGRQVEGNLEFVKDIKEAPEMTLDAHEAELLEHKKRYEGSNTRFHKGLTAVIEGFRDDVDLDAFVKSDAVKESGASEKAKAPEKADDPPS